MRAEYKISQNYVLKNKETHTGQLLLFLIILTGAHFENIYHKISKIYSDDV